MYKCDLQSADDVSSNHSPLDETVVRVNDQQYWLYVSDGPKSSELLYIRLFSTTTTALTEIFLSELVERHNVSDTVFLVDGSTPLQTVLRRCGLRFQYKRRENRSAIENIIQEVKYRIYLFSNFVSYLNIVR